MTPSCPIAIVGIGGIFPGAKNIDDFWDNIKKGKNSSAGVPESRWSLPVSLAYHPGNIKPDKVYSYKGCFLDELPVSDILSLEKTGLSEDFLHQLDPLYHITLYAGINAFKMTHSVNKEKTGVIIGNIALPTDKSSAFSWETVGKTFTEAALKSLPLSFANISQNTSRLNCHVNGMPAAFLSRTLGLSGGSYTIDAACASSLYAIKLACDELISGRADTMLSGGVSRPDCLYTQMGFSQLNALSPDGICSPFDEKGNGLVIGEGAGIVVLKRLSDAVNAKDRIFGIIRGIGLSNDIDGNLLAPSSEGQLRSMNEAYRQAGWSPGEVELIECHATGTPLGDAVEVASLKKLWKDEKYKNGQCVIGSVKSNIGHLLTAAGCAGLIKVLMAIKESILPPTASFKKPAPEITFDGSPFKVLSEPEKWERKSTPKKSAVSAFGFGGINAHILIEEWMPENSSKPSSPIRIREEKNDNVPIAIIGMDAHIGSFEGIESINSLISGITPDGNSIETPREKKNWFGVTKSAWFMDKFKIMDEPSSKYLPEGFGIDEVTIPIGMFRIPPKELEEMLPQQALMLKVAYKSIQNANIDSQDHTRSGVFIGINFDFNTTNFHIRWSILNEAEKWADENNIDPDRKKEWIGELADSFGPALNANRTMGALGSIVASRIARELKIGGPSFTISSEEDCSGAKAIETAIRRLQDKEIDLALAGAVDMTGDIRILIEEIENSLSDSYSCAKSKSRIPSVLPFFGEGAGCLVLKRLSDAERDNNRILAVIRGSGSSITNNIDSLTGSDSQDLESSFIKSYETAMKRACRDAIMKPEEIDYLEMDDLRHIPSILKLFTGPDRKEPLALGYVREHIGKSGAAQGITSIIKLALCLSNRTLPALNTPMCVLKGENVYIPEKNQHWLKNRAWGPRKASTGLSGIDGNHIHIILEEYVKPGVKKLHFDSVGLHKPQLKEGLFIIEGADESELKEGLINLRSEASRLCDMNIDSLAHKWQTERCKKIGKAISLVSRNQGELIKQIDFSIQNIFDGRNAQISRQTLSGQRSQIMSQIDDSYIDGIYYHPEQSGLNGNIAFVYPGSGNHFPGMGREMCLIWPDIPGNQDQECLTLRNQILPQYFWNMNSLSEISDNHRILMVGQVSLCTVITDILTSFGVKPDCIIGYSLGEMAGIFSMRAWNERDLMIERMNGSNLFTEELAGKCLAARKSWNLNDDREIEWSIGVVNSPPETIRKKLIKRKRVYLLIINTGSDCVIGGDRAELEDLVNELGCGFLPVTGVTTVHCEVVKAVAKTYRDFHLFETITPERIRFYSTASGKAYVLTKKNAADAILAQAVDTIDFMTVINNSYADGARIFIEAGPGSSLTRMIGSILSDRPHFTGYTCVQGQSESTSIMHLLGRLKAIGININPEPLYSGPGSKNRIESIKNPPKQVTIKSGCESFAIFHPPFKKTVEHMTSNKSMQYVPAQVTGVTVSTLPVEPAMRQFESILNSRLKAHETYLRFSKNLTELISKNITLQMEIINSGYLNDISLNELKQLYGTMHDTDQGSTDRITSGNILITESRVSENRNEAVLKTSTKPLLDRDMCYEFAVGSVAKVLGPAFTPVDSHPTRVRLPDEPLMLVDRIMEIIGEPMSMTSGRVITEHDVRHNAWYLDGNRIPTCIAVEAGQADLFLSGYLGIDMETKGLAVYRLLDAVVTFHRDLPGPGDVISYNIQIERFFTQGDTYLFRFNFESTVNGEPLLSMKKGCAGFFTREELESGRGIIHTALDKRPFNGIMPKDWTYPVRMAEESYGDKQIDALRKGDLAYCFGSDFEGLTIKKPHTIPGGRMKLVHRVLHIDPNGGRFKTGFICSEADINPLDWFLTCHFSDDNVMPGTLMYECCMHTLRVFLLRMGWIGEEGEVVFMPVPGVESSLKCRGQVIESTRKASYEISIKEIGYRPEPYAIADALMYADGRPIVEILNMSIRLCGASKESIEKLWRNQRKAKSDIIKKKAIFDNESIMAFAVGKPSVAFGEPYSVFDDERIIARLPGPPYKFLDRITEINAQPWKMIGGGTIEAQYDIPSDAWYFSSNRQPFMPFSVLLEVALQPCGWFAAYLGSALTSETDLSFRNLGGAAIQYEPVTPDTGTLTTKVRITRVSSSGGMIIQHYDFDMSNGSKTIYMGNTYFGFFSKQALADQVGIRDAKPFIPSESDIPNASSIEYPDIYPYPDRMLKMLDRINVYIPNGGPWKLGYIKGTMKVDPSSWYFKAHFYQDPVIPGSLGLESLLQLLRFHALMSFPERQNSRIMSCIQGYLHEWVYRGQVIPKDRLVTVEANIKSLNKNLGIIIADGWLSVDGRYIYEMKDFSLLLENKKE